MNKAFITGANKGIGFATAKQLLEKGYYVFLGSRDLKKGVKAVEKLNHHGFTNVKAIQLDVTDNDSIMAAFNEINKKISALDILINNAGINGGSPYTVLEASPEQFKNTFDTNVFGVASVTKVFIELLGKSDQPRIVNVSSSVGSLTLQSDPTWPAYDYAKYGVYSASKAALNMYTVNLAYELRNTPFKVNAVCPGYTSTDFTDRNGGEVEIAAQRIVKYALINHNGPTGKFFSEETNPQTGEVPW
ncbi:short-chain dehydrogenase/reductase SDR [Galbibacter marinus]|uniref:Short-chain dehydrogenase/reductase SDR n=1 Tax=Galbibacter marinus TaxID=555500 RepID=K2PPR3_9FLAO|nr:SDR family oxidoreductase [Galbibacter marinus]EKF54545.1 short-chain dehydrogenase/reductase SDR [Galbibacter marinus]